uniref:Lysine-specific permease n=1 Tax=Candidatus Aschnera chinzeii TaxID=1485666 RepID=A0AAT9G482_9ENTR|nr:MAG: lysine-specific permease [Candidatus Aschnera chinzeii]
MLSKKNIINRSAGKFIKLQRVLEIKHLVMIAIGSSIGTGLFISSGSIIAQAGPVGTVCAYLIIGFMVYFLINSLSELTIFLPVSGSFVVYASNYVDEAFGFALGWNYWYNWAITIAVDLMAIQFIMGYWFPFIDKWVWSLLFLFLIFIINVFSVKGFGEIEYLFSFIKITSVIIFIIVSVLIIFGFIGDVKNINLYNFNINKIFNYDDISKNFIILMNVAFCFQGIELIGITTGESKSFPKNFHKIVKNIFWIILFLYVTTIAVISIIIPNTHLNPLYIDNIHTIISPFTLLFKYTNLIFIATIVNFIILISIISAGNLGLYASSRMLYNLSLEKKAPKIFSHLSTFGVPVYSLVATTLVAGLCFFSVFLNEYIVYQWLLNISSMTGLIVWIGISLSHYRFRKGYIFNGHNIKCLSYCDKWFPFGPIIVILISLITILGFHYYILMHINLSNIYNIIMTYIGDILFCVIFMSYKIIKKTHLIKYHEMKFDKQ